MSDIKTKKKFDSHKEGIRIVRVAAFCFAIVSWIATAQGLYEYVFKNHYELSLLISFGIQSILFVFNLKLPEYIAQIGDRFPNNKREHKKYIFWEKKGKEKSTFKWLPIQKLIVVFYAVVLFASSFFSFVYMSNLVYQDTRYIDANIVLDRTYRTYLDETDKYVNELTKITQIGISKNLSELQKLAPDNRNEKLKSELENDVKKAETDYNNKIYEENEAKSKRDSAETTFKTPMTERWRDDKTYEEEKLAYEKAELNFLTAQENTKVAKQILNSAKQALENYQPSVETTVHDLLTEILKSSPEPDVLNSHIKDLTNVVVQMDSTGLTAQNFADIVIKTQELTIAINDYSVLRSTKSAKGDNNDISDFNNSLINDDIVIPEPSSDKFDEQKALWESKWKKRFSSLEAIIKSIPNYSKNMGTEIENVDEIVNIQLLSEFDSHKIANSMDRISRSNLANINVLERSSKLLFSDFPFLAWFSFILALFFDIASLLAGLFIYLTSSVKSKPISPTT